MAKKLSDVSGLITQLCPRATDIGSDRLEAILNSVVKNDIEDDLVTCFRDTMTGHMTLKVPQIAALTPTLSTSSGNIEVGIYEYAVSFVSPAYESPVGKVSAPVVVKSLGQVDITNIPKGGDEITSRKIYRRSNYSGDFLFVAEISDNTTTTYTDNIATSNLSVKAPGFALPSDFDYVISLHLNQTPIPVVRAAAPSDQGNYYASIDYSFDPPALVFSSDTFTSGDLKLVYRKKIGDVDQINILPYPEGLHSRLLPILAFGASFYYLANKPGGGDDDLVAKTQVQYETAQANLFDNGAVS